MHISNRFSCKIFLLVFVMVFLGCKSKYEDCTEADYNSCNTFRPETGIAEILITITRQNPQVTVSLFEGDFENGNLVWEKVVKTKRITEVLDVEKNYSFTASYHRDGTSILAVDGGAIEVVRYTMCEYTCYETKVLTIDLELK